jgi:hypothetical protein
MPDGSVILGAQGNFPFDRAFARALQANATDETARAAWRFLFATPWLRPDPLRLESLEAMVEAHRAIPPGVMARHRTSPLHPVQIPDLIGVRERRYLDRTGLQQQRSIEDLMRYAALNQGGGDLALFGDFRPVGELPDPTTRAR